MTNEDKQIRNIIKRIKLTHIQLRYLYDELDEIDSCRDTTSLKMWLEMQEYSFDEKVPQY
jgi:hypothetical protein